MSDLPGAARERADESRSVSTDEPKGNRSGARQLTLDAFIRRRLGTSGGELGQLKRMFSQSFGAGSFAGFWRYWNPVYSYYLDRHCFRPLRRRLPRSLAVILTFAASGFLLHDLPFWWGVTALKTRSLPVPFVTLWFALLAGLMLVGTKCGLDYSRSPTLVRVTLNASQIAAAGLAALAIVRLAS